VNIGIELVAYPRILFLDEPISGLDSTSAFRVVKCLQRLKCLGISCVAVIHQPSFKVFTGFNDVVLLAKGGKLSYHGLPTNLMEYFMRIGFRFSPGENVADWAMDVLNHSVPRSNEAGKHFDEFRTPDDFKAEWLLELLEPNRDCFDESTKEGKGLTSETTMELLYHYQFQAGSIK
jgi:ABC-type multidrug transport system ATPase subunit